MISWGKARLESSFKPKLLLWPYNYGITPLIIGNWPLLINWAWLHCKVRFSCELPITAGWTAASVKISFSNRSLKIWPNADLNLWSSDNKDYGLANGAMDSVLAQHMGRFRDTNRYSSARPMREITGKDE